MLLAEGRQIREGIYRSCTDGSGGADYEKWLVPLFKIPLVLNFQSSKIHALPLVDADPANRIRAESCDVSRFLYPGMCFLGSVDKQGRPPGDALLSNIPSGSRGTGSQETSEIGHVAAAQKQAATIGRIADELREPSNCLGFYFGCHGRQFPGADVGIYRSRQQFREHPDGSGGRGDVAVKSRMAVEQRVVKQQVGGALKQDTCRSAIFRKCSCCVQRCTDFIW